MATTHVYCKKAYKNGRNNFIILYKILCLFK
jgi:hypothetical protein